MFLKQIEIKNNTGIIQSINFHKGLNLIVDETPVDDKKKAGNNIGKTTVLRLVDFSLGSDGKNIYKDSEFKEQENTTIKDFLIDSEVLVCLTLVDDLDFTTETITIERNFLKRKKKIQKINGESIPNAEFEKTLKKMIFKTDVDKPSFRQIISKNIRDEKGKLTNIVKVLSPYTSTEEYEALFLFWLGIDTDTLSRKKSLSEEKTREESFRRRLKKDGELSLIEQQLGHINTKIEEYQNLKNRFYFNEEFEARVNEMNRTKSEISNHSSEYSRLNMRKELILESKEGLENEKTSIDVKRIGELYQKATKLIPDLQVSFEETVEFHNDLIEEKIKYIEKELPTIECKLKELSESIFLLRKREKELSEILVSSEYSEDYEEILTELNNYFEHKGNLENKRNLWQTSTEKLQRIKEELDNINSGININDDLIQKRITIFNKHFTKISNQLYGEEFLLSSVKNEKGYDLVVTNIEGNPSTGKKKGQIAAFDFAYILFAEEINIEYINFIMHDQLENIHDNQLSTILMDLSNSIDCQFILPIVKDKLPEDIDVNDYIILKLSENEKLFKI